MTPFEPSGDMRQAAGQLWNLFQALKQVGFTEDQALRIIGSSLSGKAQ